jgi:hypothetical protein
MQRAPDATPGELISIGEAARQVGINKSTLSRQVKSGAVRSHKGKVVLSEVLADRASNIDLTQSRRRPAGKSKRPDATASKADATGAGGAAPDATDDDDLVLIDGKMVSFAQAQRIKENYLARQRALDFERDAGRLVDRQAAEKAFFETARQIRDAWLSWPARVATLMASDLGIEERKLVEVLTDYVRQHLTELGEPAAPDIPRPN